MCKQKLYLMVTTDKLSLPLAVADSQSGLARLCGVSDSTVGRSLERSRKGIKTKYIEVEIDEEEESGMGAKKECNMDCLNCRFDKCLDEMTRAEKRKAMRSITPPPSRVKEVDPAVEAARKEKARAYSREYYQKNKEKWQKRTEEDMDMGKKKKEDVVSEMEVVMEVPVIEEDTDVIPVIDDDVRGVPAMEPVVEAAPVEGYHLLLTPSQAESLANFLATQLIPAVKADTEFDNLLYLADLCDIWRQLNTGMAVKA